MNGSLRLRLRRGSHLVVLSAGLLSCSPTAPSSRAMPRDAGTEVQPGGATPGGMSSGPGQAGGAGGRGDGGQSGSGGQVAGAGGASGAGGATSPRDAAAPDAAVVIDGARDVAVDLARDAAVDVASFPRTLPAPPATWLEHWFEHRQNTKLFDYNDLAAVYVDDAVTRADIAWVLPYAANLWRYTKEQYGAFGADPRVYWVLHQGNVLTGGHPSGYLAASHDFRNVNDSGLGSWVRGAIQVGLPTHETAHIVEFYNNGVRGSPAFRIWGDSKWAEIFEYDVYVGMGMTAEAQAVFTRFSAVVDTFPRAGTRWFRDWYYPIYKDHGGAKMLAKFFSLLAQHFPKAPENGGRNQAYTRDMNFGEYVHFMSGAAATDLKPLASSVFGWPPEREAEHAKARTDFRLITY